MLIPLKSPIDELVVELATTEAEHLIRKHKLRQLEDLELEALIDALMFERDCRTCVHLEV